MSADEVYEFNLTIPLGTTPAAPAVLPCVMPVRIVDEFTWRVPPGHNGVTGFRLSMGGVQVFPANIGSYIVASGETATWQVKDVPDSGAWDVTAYNTGTVTHKLYVRFLVRLFRRQAPRVTPWAHWQLASVPDLSRAGAPVPGRP